MDSPKMEELYQEIGQDLMDTIPEEWTKVLLYARISKELSLVYFFFHPIGNKEPVYSLDIPKKWDFSEQEFDKLNDQLVKHLMQLWNEFIDQKHPPWTNLTLTLESTGHFSFDYDYTNLEGSNDYENKVIWKYKRLGIRPDPKDKWETKMINDFLKKQNK